MSSKKNIMVMYSQIGYMLTNSNPQKMRTIEFLLLSNSKVFYSRNDSCERKCI